MTPTELKACLRSLDGHEVSTERGETFQVGQWTNAAADYIEYLERGLRVHSDYLAASYRPIIFTGLKQ